MAKKTAVKKSAGKPLAAPKSATARAAATPASKSPGSKSTKKAAPAKAGHAPATSAGARKAPALATNSTPKKPQANTSTMTTRKPTASKGATGKTVPAAAPVKGATKPAAKAGAKAADKPTPAARAAPAGARPAGTTAARNGAVSAKVPAAKGKGARDESRTPASLARAAMQSAEKAREAAKPRKSPYGKPQLLPLRKALLEMRTRLIGDLNQMEKEALRADDADVDVENVADHGTDAFERNMTLGLMEGEARTLRLIGEALDAIEAGRYGLCSACGEAIPIARLEALPFAGTCVPCQEAQERRM